MSVSVTESAVIKPGGFGRAVLVAAAVELGLIGGVLWVATRSAVKPQSPRREIMAVHVVDSARPKPRPARPRPAPVSQQRPTRSLAQAHPVPLAGPVPLPTPLVVKNPVSVPPRFTFPVEVATQLPGTDGSNSASRASAVTLYAALVRARVQENLRVPETIRLMGLSGRTEVAFELQPDGDLLWARIARSCGVNAVDRVALRTVRTTEYPPFIKNMPREDTTFDVEVHISGRAES